MSKPQYASTSLEITGDSLERLSLKPTSIDKKMRSLVPLNLRHIRGGKREKRESRGKYTCNVLMSYEHLQNKTKNFSEAYETGIIRILSHAETDNTITLIRSPPNTHMSTSKSGRM